MRPVSGHLLPLLAGRLPVSQHGNNNETGSCMRADNRACTRKVNVNLRIL